MRKWIWESFIKYLIQPNHLISKFCPEMSKPPNKRFPYLHFPFHSHQYPKMPSNQNKIGNPRAEFENGKDSNEKRAEDMSIKHRFVFHAFHRLLSNRLKPTEKWNGIEMQRNWNESERVRVTECVSEKVSMWHGSTFNDRNYKYSFIMIEYQNRQQSETLERSALIIPSLSCTPFQNRFGIRFISKLLPMMMWHAVISIRFCSIHPFDRSRPVSHRVVSFRRFSTRFHIHTSHRIVARTPFE